MSTPETPALREVLEHACIIGDIDLVRRLVAEHGAAAVRLDADSEELTTLHLAAVGGSDPLVKYLLSEAVQANPRAAHSNAFTPLHAGAMNGHTLICRALLDSGAAIDAQTQPQGYAALHSAAFGGHLGTVRLLLSRGASRSLLNYRGETPAATARRTGKHEVAALLDLPTGA